MASKKQTKKAASMKAPKAPQKKTPAKSAGKVLKNMGGKKTSK